MHFHDYDNVDLLLEMGKKKNASSIIFALFYDSLWTPVNYEQKSLNRTYILLLHILLNGKGL